MNLDQVAVITGAARGIGKGIALRFRRAGMKLALLDVDLPGIEQWTRELAEPGEGILAIRCDITKEEEALKARDQILKQFGRIDVLVNNAGILPPLAPLEHVETNHWRATLDINLTGAFLCTKVFGGAMLDKGGSIINIASQVGLVPSPGRGAYSVSKAGMLMLTELTAVEWGSRNVRANAICPGYLETELTAQMYSDPEVKRRRSETIPMKRLGSVEDIAEAAFFLASSQSNYMNGEFLRVDGGFVVGAVDLSNAIANGVVDGIGGGIGSGIGRQS